MAGYDWLEIEDTGKGRRYTIKQDKWSLLSASLGAVIASAIFGFIAYLFALTHPNSSSVLAIPFGILAILGLLWSVGLILAGLLVGLARKSKSVFRVNNDGIYLERKISRSYPSVVKLEDISHIYHGTPRAPVAALATTGPAAVMTMVLSARGSGVWVNTRGRDVYLANNISASEAEYLFNNVSSAIGFS